MWSSSKSIPLIPKVDDDDGVNNDCKPRFLRPGEKRALGGSVALTSYPRSGNSMMRGLLERSTGLITGSDTNPRRRLSVALGLSGYLGEGVVGRSWIVKTHFPERIGWKPYNCNRVILLVRNPFDAIDSHFNMALTRTHNRSLDETEYVRLKDRWEEFVLAEMDVWCRFHRYWILKAIKSKVPLLVLRFEDVVRDKTLNLRRTLGFLCEGTTTRSDDFLASCEKRLELSTRSKGGGAGYKPRSSGGPGKSLVHYDEKLCQRIQDKIPNILISLRAFGYENLLCGKRDVIDRVDLSPNNLMEALKISKDATTTMSPCEGESKRRKQMWRKGSRGSFPSRPSIGVNESSELIRPQTKSDVSRRGIQWSRHLHRAGIRFKGAKEITPVL